MHLTFPTSRIGCFLPGPLTGYTETNTPAGLLLAGRFWNERTLPVSTLVTECVAACWRCARLLTKQTTGVSRGRVRFKGVRRVQTVMVIPSYWGRERAQGWRPGDAVYDHPTPLDGEGTLQRTLESLRVLRCRDFRVVVLAVPTNDEIAAAVEQRVGAIVYKAAAEQDVPMSVFGPSQLARVHEEIERRGLGYLKDLLRLRGYANVRNLCIFVPHVLGADTAVLIDDDEVFEDPDFMDKALEAVGRTLGGEPVYAVAGYYRQPDGGFLVPEPAEAWARAWGQIEAMNQAFKAYIGRPPRYKVTPFAFGGNLVLHRALFTRVPFDPGVPRGEDIDYVINARIFGFTVFLDRTLAIRHRPPPKTHPAWRRLREDVLRFVYEREKIRRQTGLPGTVRVRAEDFDPYPGAFLKDDLELRAERAARALAEAYRQRGDPEGAREALRTLELMRAALENPGDPFAGIVRLQQRWAELMGTLSRPELQRGLAQALARA